MDEMIKSENEKLIIEDISFSKTDLLNKKYIPKRYKEDISSAGIIVIPSENVRDGLGLTFPERTVGIVDYLQSTIDTTIEYAVDDDEFQELELHSIDVVIPILFVAQEIMLPIVLSGVYDFIKSKVIGNRELKATVELEIYHETKEGSKHIKYKGPLKGLEEVIKKSEL